MKDIIDSSKSNAPARINRQARYGVISFWLAMIPIALLLLINLGDMMQLFPGKSYKLSSNALIVLGILILCAALAGAITGTLGVAQKTHKRGLAIAGLIICGGYLLYFLSYCILFQLKHN